MKKNFKVEKKSIEELKQDKSKYLKSMIAAAMQCLLGVSSIVLGIGVSIYAKGFVSPPVIAGTALSCAAIALTLREYKKYKLAKEEQIINDGENDLIVCATKEYKGTWYAYLLKDNTDEVGFYKINIENGVYNFELVENKKEIEELILLFAKEYAEKNPNALKELDEYINSNDEEESN